jgi:membrane-bound hydrogenase subunit beta
MSGDINGISTIAAELQATFSLPEGACKVQRATRLWVEVDRRSFPAVFEHLVKSKGFSILCTITGLDMGAELGFIYHLANEGGIMVNLKTRIPKGEPLTSVTPYFPGADIYERELDDLLGVKVEGLGPGERYPLPEDWPQGDHPLLKDWKQPVLPDPVKATTTGAAPATSPTEKGAIQ